MAVLKPSILKASPIRPSVIIKVTALMTKRNNPKVTTVTGNVSRMRNGLTSTFKTDKMKLAPKAAPIPLK